MTEPSPIIIVGAARSGTKFLRDILAASNGVCAVPYDVNYVWRYGAEDTPSDVLDPNSLSEKRAHFIHRTLCSLAKVGPDDILVEKTVSNTLRIPFVDRAIPTARYVHLVRDGRDVAESAMRQWQAPPDWRALWVKLRGMPIANLTYVTWFSRNLFKGLISGRRGGSVWGPRFPNIDAVAAKGNLAEVCSQQWVECVGAAARDLSMLPNAKDRVFEIRYEDLIADENSLRSLAVALELPDIEAVLSAFRTRLHPSSLARWESLPTNDRATFERIMRPTLDAKGYTS